MSFNSIISITKGPRESNFELLRIIAMLMVLMVHANFWALGNPKAETFVNNPFNAITRTVLESLSIVCVNVFVMISGWFKIRPSIKGFCNFVFQCLYFYIGVYLSSCLINLTEFSLGSFISILCLSNSGWFVKAYLFLYILSPILNIFLEKTSKKKIEFFLISFYILQTLYWYTDATNYIASGYSPLSFIGLYILANYLRTYKFSWVNKGIWIYFSSVIILSCLYIINILIHPLTDVYSYSNPIVILGSMGIILWTKSIKLETNKIINFISRSAFAVFLFHTCPGVPPFFAAFSNKIYDNFSGIQYLMIELIYILIIFAVAIFLDQPRKWLWNFLSADKLKFKNLTVRIKLI